MIKEHPCLYFREEGVSMVKILDKDAISKRPTPLAQITSRFTLNTISETSMGVKLDTLDVAEADEYRRNVYDLGGFLLDRFLKPWLHDERVYSFSTLKMRIDKVLKPMHAFTKSLITKRRSANALESLSSAQITPEADNM